MYFLTTIFFEIIIDQIINDSLSSQPQATMIQTCRLWFRCHYVPSFHGFLSSNSSRFHEVISVSSMFWFWCFIEESFICSSSFSFMALDVHWSGSVSRFIVPGCLWSGFKFIVQGMLPRYIRSGFHLVP